MRQREIVAGRRRKSISSDDVFNVVLLAVFILFLVILLYPIVFVVSSSFSSGAAVTGGKVLLWPVEPSLMGYRAVLAYRLVWVGYGNTLLYTFVGTAFNLVLTVFMAYPLSRRNFQGRKMYTIIFILLPMFFGGGLIPTYILVSKLGLVNTRIAMIVLGGIGISNVIIMRTFFGSSVPEELLESAKMDGITDIGYLVKVMLPLSKAVLAVITLYCVVGHWNSYTTPMIYLHDQSLYPLQIVLRQILNASKLEVEMIDDPEIVAQRMALADVLKYALIVVATVPMMIFYPFVQKFFAKGVMIGSLKG